MARRWAKNLLIGVFMGFVVLGRSFSRAGVTLIGLLLLVVVAIFTAFILDATAPREGRTKSRRPVAVDSLCRSTDTLSFAGGG
jgi:hypothetical protein